MIHLWCNYVLSCNHKINQLPKTSRGTVCNFLCNGKFILQVVNVMGCLGIVTSTRRCTFLICDDNLLLERSPNPSRKWRDRSRGKRNIVSTLRWWTVAYDGCSSFKQTDGQVEKIRKKYLYFAMMICCCWWISVLQGHLGTGGERKQWLIVLWADDVFPWSDASPWS